jgi:uncharacterized protein
MKSCIAIMVIVLCCGCALAQTDTPQERYERGLNALTGTWVSRNDSDGFELVKSAAKDGYVPAQVTMGLFWDRDGGGNYSEAVYWYTKAAEQGDALAQWLLGRILLLGYAGYSSSADGWLQKSADAGNPFGAYLLGLDLVDDDPKEAVPYFRQAAEQGLPYAQFRLGIAYREGKGVAQDKSEAYIWLLLSSAQLKKIQPALLGNLLSLLENDLGEKKVAAAKSEARRRDEKLRRSVLAGGCTWKGAMAEFPTPPPVDVQKFCQEKVLEFNEEKPAPAETKQ